MLASYKGLEAIKGALNYVYVIKLNFRNFFYEDFYKKKLFNTPFIGCTVFETKRFQILNACYVAMVTYILYKA